jgi:hypothetical protein
MTKVSRGHQLFMFRPFVLGQAFMSLAIHVFTVTRMILPNLSSLNYIKFLIPGVHTLPTFIPFKTLLLLEHLHHKLVNSSNKIKVTRSSLDLIHFRATIPPTATAHHKARKKKGKDGLHKNCIIIPKEEEDCEVKDKNNKRRSEVS